MYAHQTASDVMTPGKIPEYTKFVPEYLKPLGYRSYHTGKWHMKHVTGQQGVGFDHSYTMLDELRFFTQNRHELDGVALPKPDADYYSTTAIADYGVRFLDEHAREHASDPFFLYAAFHAPHFPLHALQEDIDRYKDRFAEGWDISRQRRWERMRRMGLVNCALPPLERDQWPRWNTPEPDLLAKVGPGEVYRAESWKSLTAEQQKFQRLKMAIHAAMITRMDVEIGKMLKQVERMGALDNTVVLFLSDNGASAEQLIRGDGHDASARPGSAMTHLGLGPGWSSCANAPFRLHKAWLHEGGIASPLIAHWPAGMKEKNKLRHDACHFVDVLPTMLDLAGGKPVSASSGPTLAGRSLAPAMTGKGHVSREFLYFNHNNNRALRVGDMKLLSTGEGGAWELYDLAKDRAEQVNLASKRPDVVKEMAAKWAAADEEYVRVRESAQASGKVLMRRGRDA
jgi:arylsulfatase